MVESLMMANNRVLKSTQPTNQPTKNRSGVSAARITVTKPKSNPSSTRQKTAKPVRQSNSGVTASKTTKPSPATKATATAGATKSSKSTKTASRHNSAKSTSKKQNIAAIIVATVLVLAILAVPLVEIVRCCRHDIPVKQPPAPATAVSFDQTVGACGFIDDPIDNVLAAVGLVREYHNYRWLIEQPGNCRFNIQKNWWDWDKYYQNLRDRDIEPVPCIQGTSQADRKNYNGNKQQKPINADEDSLAAASYSEHASTMFQVAARYGQVKVDDSKLLLEETQTRVSGLGLLKYYENWNEPDKTWEGAECHFSGAEFAAMCSADFDGDEGRLGDTYGIKNADPDAKLVMGGIAGGRWTCDYLDEMAAWAKEHRADQQIPIDVINFHMYSGKSHPEAYEYVENFAKICAWRDQNAPHLEIWMTEFGWDTNSESPHGATTAQQRDWLMRTYLIANAHGIDRSTMYMTRDTSASSSTGKYATSGLVKQDRKTKKTSWYGVATLKNTLKDYVMQSIVTETADVYVYQLAHKDGGALCYAVWRPTVDGSTYHYQLSVGTATTATLTTFAANKTTGNTTDLTVTNGVVTLTVTETPQFVKLPA